MQRLACWQPVLAALVAALLPTLPWAGVAGNPFLGQQFYVNPGNAEQFESSITTATGKVKQNLLKMQKVPSAYWIDKKEKIRGHDLKHMEGILRDAASKPKPELVVLIWYDLPNRDCDAKASNGEICCTYTPEGRCDYEKVGDCSDGIYEYKTTYVDPFVQVLQEFQDSVPIVVVVEPDSLPNLATNTGHPKCGNPATASAYKVGVKYALDQLTEKAPKVTVYLDSSHGGWLGWQNNLMKFMNMLKDLDLPLDKVRGFATNVANYQPLGIQCPWCPDSGYRNGFCLNNKHQSHPCCDDPCRLSSQYNFGNNELNYAAGLVAAANGELGMDAHVIIDTGRNGVDDQRQDCANWCNPRNAGAGIPSTTETANKSLVDAYYWLKTPGESDGCSQTLPNGKTCPRFDAGCASVDSLGVHSDEEPAPEAGSWYDFQVKQLAQLAAFEGSKMQQAALEDHEQEMCDANGGQQQQQQPQQPQQQQQQQQASRSSSSQASGGSSSSSGQCGGAWEQCGGNMWNGPKCCEEGCQCLTNGPSYSQCVPTKPGGSCSPSPQESLPLGTLPPAQVEQADLPEPAPSPARKSTTRPPFLPASVLPDDVPATQLTPFPSIPLLPAGGLLTPQPTPKPAGATQLPPVPSGTFMMFLGKDCYGDGDHNAYGNMVGDPSTCRALCFFAHRDCTAVVVWKTSCFFRTKADCYSRLTDAVDHTTYILKDRSSEPQAGTSPFSDVPMVEETTAPPPEMARQPMSVIVPVALPTPAPAPSTSSTAAVPEGAFKTLSGMDCFGGENAYGKVGRPETCRQECLNEHPDCVAVVRWGNLCFFRNKPTCSQNLVGSPLHTTYLRVDKESQGAGVSIASSEQEQFETIHERDCFSGHNAYHDIADPSTCKSECLHDYNDCVAVVVWKDMCFFRNKATCRSNLESSPDHTLYVVKGRSGGTSGFGDVLQRSALPSSLELPTPAVAGASATGRSSSQQLLAAAGRVAPPALGNGRPSGLPAAMAGAASAGAAFLGVGAAVLLLAAVVRGSGRQRGAMPHGAARLPVSEQQCRAEGLLDTELE